MERKFGSSCPPLLRKKRPGVFLPLLLTCRGDWVEWEPWDTLGAMAAVHGQKWKAPYVPVLTFSFSAAIPNKPFAISYPARLGCALCHAQETGAKHAVSSAYWGCKLNCGAICPSSWEGCNGLFPWQKQTPSSVGKTLIRTSLWQKQVYSCHLWVSVAFAFPSSRNYHHHRQVLGFSRWETRDFGQLGIFLVREIPGWQ